MAHPFSALSPDLQREQLTAADAWPLLSVALDSQQPPRLLASARHMPANVDVLSIPLAGSPIEASPLLWWFAFTEQLTENEISLLTTHHDASWLPYASCMSALIDWGARASTLAQATLRLGRPRPHFPLHPRPPPLHPLPPPPGPPGLRGGHQAQGRPGRPAPLASNLGGPADRLPAGVPPPQLRLRPRQPPRPYPRSLPPVRPTVVHRVEPSEG